MKKILLSLATLYTLGQAGETLLIVPNTLSVDWKAYKTLGKIGVGGKFTSLNYSSKELEGKDLASILVGSKVSIDTKKIDTGNSGRDDTLVKFFFEKMSSSIEATIKEINTQNSTVDVMITMNEKSLLIPMKYSYIDSKFRAEGTIDILDFDAKSALDSISKSCYDLHKGKTWSDVSIGFEMSIKATK